MIKCPHCGSTAQPKRVGITSVSANGKYFCENYKCGCGCYFEALYPREVEEYFIHYLEDIEGWKSPQKNFKNPLTKQLKYGIINTENKKKGW